MTKFANIRLPPTVNNIVNKQMKELKLQKFRKLFIMVAIGNKYDPTCFWKIFQKKVKSKY